MRRRIGAVATSCAAAGLSAYRRRTHAEESKPQWPTFSSAEVAAHNVPGDSWVIIDGHVYDVTRYLANHPGGSDVLRQYAGRDATKAFTALHAQDVLLQVASNFKIGELAAQGQEIESATHSPARSDESTVSHDAALQTLEAIHTLRKRLTALHAAAATTADANASAATPSPPQAHDSIAAVAHGSETARAMDAIRLDAAQMGRMLSLDSIRSAAESVMPPSLRLYVGYGAEDEETVSANRHAWSAWTLRPRVLTACGVPTTTARVLGCDVSSPVLVAPFASASACHVEGELAVARASAATGCGYVVPHFGGQPLERVYAASASSVFAQTGGERRTAVAPDAGGGGAPGPALFFQLYPPRTPSGELDREYTLRALQHVEQLGCRAVFVTVDTPTDGNRERTYKSEAWLASVAAELGSMPRVRTLEGAGLPRHPGHCTKLGWSDISWMRSHTSMKVVVKGIMTAEDAAMAAKHADAIVVSNHGGRQLDAAAATVDVLRECVEAVDGRIEVLVDGGVRRGKDVFRALALGASGVLVGRPVAYGLALGGEAGVSRVLAVLQEELANVMQLCGCASVGDIRREHVQRRL